ncbi:MAG: hypothetical protein ACR2QF_06180 [Geminicoccaceae bacterium]
MPKPRKRIMRTFKLNEISAVDTPAQQGARMVIMKRHDLMSSTSPAALDVDHGDKTKKSGDLVDAVTSADEGHQHGIRIRTDYEGKVELWISYADDADGNSHDHQLVRDSDGKIVVTENAGHSHTVDETALQSAMLNAMIGKAEPESPDDPGASADNLGTQPSGDKTMAEKNAGDQSAELKKKDDVIGKLQAVIDLSPEHRAHYDGLQVSKRDDFLTLPDGDKDAAIEALQKADPVVYTSDDGTEYRKSDDARLVKMAKERDADKATTDELRKEASDARFAKQAEDVLGLVPGEAVVKVAVIRQVHGIEDEDQRNAALKMLGDANKVYKMALTTSGVKDTTSLIDVSASPQAILDQAIEKCAEEDGVSIKKATDKIMATEQGQRLYDAIRADRRSRSGTAS